MHILPSPRFTIQLIAPSGYAEDMAFERGVQFLRAQGHIVRGTDIGARRYQRFAGTDQERLNDINAIADLPADTDIVMAVRGQYGLSRLLPGIDFKRLAQRINETGLKLLGHSDFTALQMALLAHGASSYSGPMLRSDFGVASPNEVMLDHFHRTMAMQEAIYCRFHDAVGSSNITCQVSGLLWGGNLAMLCSLLGTPYFPDIHQGILVIEDIHEPPYRIERMLLQLHQAGILARQQALVLGDFSLIKKSEDERGYDFATMVQYLRTVLPLPIVTDLPYGHIANTLTLPMGQQARLQIQGADACLHWHEKA